MRNIAKEIKEGMQLAVRYMDTYEKPGRPKNKKQRNRRVLADGTVVHEIFIPDEIDVKDIRKNLGMSQTDFAKVFGISSSNIRHWEQGDRKPSGLARTLLALISKNPKEVLRLLAY